VSPVTYWFGIAAAVLALLAILELLRRVTLRERHAVWWLVGGLLALIVAVFPQTLTWAADLLGVVVPLNLVFFIAIALLFLVSLQYGAELTRIEDKMRDMAEQVAENDLRIRALEQSKRDSSDDSRLMDRSTPRAVHDEDPPEKGHS
tara:strand:- start:155 stop:595 length:441 start_codon:yes stop_codon:yes gene_type:complete